MHLISVCISLTISSLVGTTMFKTIMNFKSLQWEAKVLISVLCDLQLYIRYIRGKQKYASKSSYLHCLECGCLRLLPLLIKLVSSDILGHTVIATELSAPVTSWREKRLVKWARFGSLLSWIYTHVNVSIFFTPLRLEWKAAEIKLRGVHIELPKPDILSI